MSNLMQTAAGRFAVREAAIDALKKRLRRFFERNTVITLEDYINGTGNFNLTSILRNLNVAHDPEIQGIYNALALLGALPATVGTVSINVSGNPADDLTGDGTPTRPYGTLWFLEDLCKTRFDHHVRILLHGSVAEESLDVEPRLGINGSFGIVGTQNFTVEDAGGVLTAVTPINAGPPVTPGTVLTVGAAAWVPQALRQSWIRVKDGANAGQTFPITDNTATTITIDAFQNLPAMGDDIEIIVPTTTITVSSQFHIRGQNASNFIANSGEAAKISLMNFRIVDAGTIPAGQFAISLESQGLQFQASFVRFESNFFAQPYALAIRTSLNGYSAYDTTLPNLTGLTGSVVNIDDSTVNTRNCGLCVKHPGTTTPDTILSADNIAVYCVCTYTQIAAIANAIILGHSSSSTHTISIYVGGYTNFYSLYNFVRNSGNEAVYLADASARYELNTFEGGTNVFTVSFGRLHIIDCLGVVAAFTNVGVEVVRLSNVLAEGNPAAISGVGGDTLWSSVGAGAAVAWPANLAAITDGAGSYIARRD